VLLQATTLNVAINASNKALLTIMMSNNFVELKGSVFKKFDRSNLFQVSCSDVRERFHLFALLFVVVVQTMKEYGWREDSFWTLAPDCLLVLGAEILVDWLKHAFITRFNEVPADVYKDYTISLAYDLAQTKQNYAFSDHSDIVSRKMGFIPLPLGVVMLRVVYTSVKSTNPGAWAVVLMAYCCLLTFRILGSIVILGKACDLVDEHQGKQEEKKRPSTEVVPNPHLLTVGSGEVVEAHNSSFDSISPGTNNPNLIKSNSSPNQNLFQLPTEPAAHRKMSEVTDVILVKMNSKMKEVEKLNEEEEEEYCEENRAYYADKTKGEMAAGHESGYFESGDRAEVVRRVGVMQQDLLGEDLVNGNISEAVQLAKDNSDQRVFKGDEISHNQCFSSKVSTSRSNGSIESASESSKDSGDSKALETEAGNLRERSSLSTSLISSSRENAGIGEEEAEEILRYRSVQRSMSSPDLVLPEGLPNPDWGVERREGEE